MPLRAEPRCRAGELTETLANFLEQQLPKAKKGDGKFALGVMEAKLGNAISEQMGIKCQSDDVVQELLRGIRLHLVRFVKAMKPSGTSSVDSVQDIPAHRPWVVRVA